MIRSIIQQQSKSIFRFNLIYQSSQGVNRLFVLLFKNTTDATVYTKHYLATVELDDYNVKIDEQNFFDQPVKTTLRIYVYAT